MSKPRLVEPGGLYHFGSRGSNKERIYFDDLDRDTWMRVFVRVVRKRGWTVLAYTLMRNHFHVVARIPDLSLSSGMQELNAVYARRTNARHERCAHLFANRFWSEPLENPEQLLTAIGYVDVNIYKATRMHPRNWAYGSYRATAGYAHPTSILAAGEVLSLFSPRPAIAQRLYRQFVHEAMARLDKSRAQSSVTEL